jgi:hypothetical protein
MKKILLIAIVALGLGSCMSEGITRESTNNDDFKVTYLFEKDGIKVYRFEDGISYHYFTTRGETITTQKSGKSYKQENITSN